MSEPLSDIEYRIRMDVSPDAVWRYLTEPQYVAEWLGCLRYEKAVDHVFYMQQDEQRRANDDIEGATHCRVLELNEPNRFAFSWYLPGTPETRVDITLRGDGAGTLVELKHSGWEQFDAAAIRSIRDALENGWRSFVLPQFKQLVAASAN